MVRLNKTVTATVKVGDDSVTFELRQPTNAEMNAFLGARYAIGKRGRTVEDTSVEARCRLFDTLCIGISGVEDATGAPIGVERVAEIPVEWKVAVILQTFEAVEVDVKN